MSDPTPSETNPESVDLAADRLLALETEVAQLRDALLRAQADQQNQARRHQRDQVDFRKFAATVVLEDLLPALDSLRLGLELAEKQPDTAVAKGFALAVQQLEGALATHGLKPVVALGQPFDPARHEALSQEASSEQPEGTVLRVLRTGWMLHERLLRPAGVVVVAPPTA